MDKPKITYHILDTADTYIKKNNTYIGTYTGDEPLTVSFRIWNNFRGTEAVEDLENFTLVLRFLTEEDSALLPYLSAIVGDEIIDDPIIENKAVIIQLAKPRILSGRANTGSDEYVDCYLPVTISFDPGTDIYLKDHDLKSLVLDISEL